MTDRLIVIEGTDCSGKETQTKLLVEKLKNAGKKVIGGIMKFCIANNYNFMDYIFLTWKVKKN